MSIHTEQHSHRRFNPMTEEWVLVSPNRNNRPWQGQVEEKVPEQQAPYEPSCYLCPGNKRNTGEINPDYKEVFVFTNDFPALDEEETEEEVFPVQSNAGHEAVSHHNLFFKYKSERGICRVVCFSPKHNVSIPEMSVTEIRKVVDVWIDEYKKLGMLPFINHIQIFENKGAIMGCSNPHPHGQIWAQESIPLEPMKKQLSQKKYWEKNHTTLLGDYLKQELKQQTRIIFENNDFVCLIPFWAVWPFETMLIPKRQVENISLFTEGERDSFAEAYKRMTMLYDLLFKISFPYSAGIHQSPTDKKPYPYWHLHICFYPPLLRSASVRKYLVGYEMFGEPQRDFTPEKSAEILKRLL